MGLNRTFLVIETKKTKSNVSYTTKSWLYLALKLAGGGGGFVEPPLGFFSLKFLPLDQLPNAFTQLFRDNEDIF